VTAVFNHRDRGTLETKWAAAGLDALRQLEPPLADACVLVVAAHPDDESLGAGGLISDAAARGARIHVLVATDGEASHPHSPTHSREPLAALRRTEVAEAVSVLAHSATVEFLGLPDGELTAHADGLAAAIAERLDTCSHVVSPWRGDRHPDHEACAVAARQAVVGRTGIEHWQYPIWGWHWASADPQSGDDADSFDALPWSLLRRLEITAAALRDKRTAMGCHVSQHSPLSDAEGDEAILAPDMLDHFTRSREVFVVEPVAPGTHASYFDALYHKADDPWGLADRFYERRKRNLLLASLPRERFRRAFEPGCASGLLTAELADRCDAVLAWDGAASAVRQARANVAGFAVSVEQRRIPDDWPLGSFDLVVLSEVGYYCDDLELLARRARDSLAADGVVVACHWDRPAPDHPHSAGQVHEALAAGLCLIVTHREGDFLLDVWSVSGESVAGAEGILS
jgi:LmbE family N-acetylglucosaminyl deacetylase